MSLSKSRSVMGSRMSKHGLGLYDPMTSFDTT